MGQREAARDKTRQRILMAARKVLLAKKFSDFTMESVARAADVSRLTVYYQFDSKTGLLEALYDYIARRGNMQQLAEVFRQGGDPLRMLDRFIRVFAEFWESDRGVIRRLHGLGAIDAEIGEGLRARNQRRRHGLSVIIKRFSSAPSNAAIDTLHMLTSFETFDALAGDDRKFEEVVEIICKQAHQAIGFKARMGPAQT